MTNPNIISKAYYYFFVLLITAVFYIPVINSDWVNWDDDHYVLENKLVQDFSFKNLLNFFHPGNRVMDTYTPLPLISFSVEYALVKDSPRLYHINNLLLHLINTALVLWLIFLLTSNIWVASFVALFFGIHPMHVESVAWITERKDLLMAVFFLLSCIYYLKFIKDDSYRKTRFYLISLGFFILSMFSKPQTAAIPLVLILFDWWQNRRFTKNMALEKIPFFLVALVMGILSMMIVDPVPVKYGFFDRILFSSYAVVIYLYKFFLPIGLSVIYDLPEKINGFYPLLVYLSLPILVVILALAIFSFRKNRLVFFGMAFFFITVGLALHFFKLTTSVIYERYTYIPYIGLLLIIAFWLDMFVRKQGNTGKRISIGILVFVVLILGSLTYQRAQVWQDSETLWTDVIEKQPDNYFGYSKRGLHYMSIVDWEKALSDFNQCLKLNSGFEEGLNNRGMTYKVLGHFNKAFADFSKAVELNENFTPALVNLGILYKESEDYPVSIEYFDRAINLESNNPEFYIHRGVVYKRMGQFKEAVLDYSSAIELNPLIPYYYYNRGFVYCLQGEFRNGIEDFTKAIHLKPDYGNAWFDRSMAYYILNDFENALINATKASEFGFPVEEGYIEELSRQQ